MRALTLQVWLVLAALTAAPAFAQRASTEDEAGDVSEVDKDSSGPLKERVRPVSGQRFLMRGRFELGPNVGISARDAFYTKYVFGLSAMYHLIESFGIGVSGGYALSIVSGAAQICEKDDSGRALGCRKPTDEELTSEQIAAGKTPAYGRQTLVLNLDFEWAPLYGKLSLVSEFFAGFNMYVVGGPSFILYGPPSGGQFTVGGNIGVGFRFFVTKWGVVKLEFRDIIYNESFTAGAVTASSLRNQMLFNIGFTFFLPTTFEEG